MRYQAITNKDFAKRIEHHLKDMGYKEVVNVAIGGARDWMLIDTETSRYTFFKHGSRVSPTGLWMYEDKNISDLFGM